RVTLVRDGDVEQGAGEHAVALGDATAVDGDQPLRDQVGRSGAGQSEHLRQRGVDAFAGQPVGHLQAAVVDLGHVVGSCFSSCSSRSRVPSMCTPRKAWITISTAAPLIDMSAMLKTG